MSSDRGQLEQQYFFDTRQIHKKNNPVLSVIYIQTITVQFGLFQGVMQESAL